MPIQFDYETDTLYVRGNEKGLEKGLEKGQYLERKKNVLSAWQKGVEPPMIANLLSLPIEQVQDIIAEFQGENADGIAKK
jgi:hypothetical protein